MSGFEPASYSGLKRPWRVSGLSLSFSTDVKNEGSEFLLPYTPSWCRKGKLFPVALQPPFLSFPDPT
jgi:hypothetical protein